MTFYNITVLKKAEEKAFLKYQVLKDSLKNPQEDITILAQKVNDAWMDYKKAKNETENCSVLQKLGDLYGC